jgi:hypothetical protein
VDVAVLGLLSTSSRSSVPKPGNVSRLWLGVFRLSELTWLGCRWLPSPIRSNQAVRLAAPVALLSPFPRGLPRYLFRHAGCDLESWTVADAATGAVSFSDSDVRTPQATRTTGTSAATTGFLVCGWEAGIRTPISRSRVCRLTVRRPPNGPNQPRILPRLRRSARCAFRRCAFRLRRGASSEPLPANPQQARGPGSAERAAPPSLKPATKRRILEVYELLWDSCE